MTRQGCSGVTVVGLVQVRLAGEDVGAARITAVSDDGRVGNPHAFSDPRGEPAQVCRQVHVLTVVRPDRYEDAVVLVIVVPFREGHRAAPEGSENCVPFAQRIIHRVRVVRVDPDDAPALS